MWTRGPELDLQTVPLPERDGDLVRDLLVAEKARRGVEIGLAYGSSALAIGEALLAVDPPIVIDQIQQQAYNDVGSDRTAGQQLSETIEQRNSCRLL
ncbi:hypothetical protein ACN261_19005 [Micromonospora sp. WMMD723]|uniref:hypothetical protein n=1 Tax=unclassified Micromonospora TaxID=2617518 RepID=UPI003B94CE8C